VIRQSPRACTASKSLGSTNPKPIGEYPVCAEFIKPGAAVCKICGAILDAEKAAQYGLGPQGPSRRESGSRQDAGKHEGTAKHVPTRAGG
jgi:hypothetical protein